MTQHQLTHYAPPKGEIEIIHHDDNLLVVSKPSGLLSVPGKGEKFSDCLTSRVRDIDTEALLVHRLDMETSGIMVFARSKSVQRILGLQFEKRKTQKIYIARVSGQISTDTGEIDLPLITDWPNRPRQKVNFEDGKSSLTKWRVLDFEEDNNVTRVELIPHTGRTHQLRVHMKEIGHPILGDSLYAPENIRNAADRLQLHAQSLIIHNPENGELMTFSDPCPF